jgi:hypothetical protein
VGIVNETEQTSNSIEEECQQENLFMGGDPDDKRAKEHSKLNNVPLV